MTWSSAQSYCRKEYTDLTSMRNQREKEAIMNVIDKSVWWVGLFRDPWQWSDHSNASFRAWSQGEPNNNGDVLAENCAGISKEGWIDFSCDKNQPFICSGKHLHCMPTNKQKNSKCFIFHFLIILIFHCFCLIFLGGFDIWVIMLIFFLAEILMRRWTVRDSDTTVHM